MKRLGSFEKIGERLAAACRDEAHTIWNDEQLAHNNEELARMTAKGLQVILFGS